MIKLVNLGVNLPTFDHLERFVYSAIEAIKKAKNVGVELSVATRSDRSLLNHATVADIILVLFAPSL